MKLNVWRGQYTLHRGRMVLDGDEVIWKKEIEVVQKSDLLADNKWQAVLVDVQRDESIESELLLVSKSLHFSKDPNGNISIKLANSIQLRQGENIYGFRMEELKRNDNGGKK